MKNVLRKLGSVKVWIALWSMALITYIVVKDRAAFNNLAMLATAPVIGYLAANVWQDKIHAGGGLGTGGGGKNDG
jgi:hypothetical protein